VCDDVDGRHCGGKEAWGRVRGVVAKLLLLAIVLLEALWYVRGSW